MYFSENTLGLHIGDQRNVKEKRQSQFAVQILIILKNVSKIWLLEEKLLNPPGMAVENIWEQNVGGFSGPCFGPVLLTP